MIKDLDYIKKCITDAGLTYRVFQTGAPEWMRVYVSNKDGVQLGRVGVQHGKLYGLKMYSGSCTQLHLLNLMLEVNLVVTAEQYDGLINLADAASIRDYNNKSEFRRLNPREEKRNRRGRIINPRKELTKRKPHKVLDQLIATLRGREPVTYGNVKQHLLTLYSCTDI